MGFGAQTSRIFGCEHRDNDNDNDHSYSQLLVPKALACPEGLSARAADPPWLAKEIRSMHNIIKQGAQISCRLN